MGCAETKVKPDEEDQPHKKSDIINANRINNNSNASDNQWPDLATQKTGRNNGDPLPTQLDNGRTDANQ